MSSIFIFNFDGTCNAPDDAEQKLDEHQQIEDNSITNILKFHLLCGGTLSKQGEGWSDKQKNYYYPGIGTYGSTLQKALNAAFSPEGSDVKHILAKALEEFADSGFDDKQDIMLVTGFSRGAALARRFAKKVADQVNSQCIYEAVFDTVASISVPNICKCDRPKSEVVFEDHSLPSNVKKALHLLSLDDKRRAFQPTLMNREDKVMEVWFAGAHADVGGGYYEDSLSDIAMRFYLNWINDLNLGIVIKQAKDINYQNIIPKQVKYSIGEDDVTINPKLLGKTHEQERCFPFNLLTLCNRLCCVIENDKVTQHLPLVHWSVAHRIYHDQDYRPNSLKEIKHKLIYQDLETVTCVGVRAHIELPQQNLTLLEVGKSKGVTVFAAEKYNRSGLMLAAGQEYQFDVSEAQHWFDASIECSAIGWDREGVKLGLKEIPIATMEPFRRVAQANWFELCASIGCEDKEQFRIALSARYTPTISGEFCPFANDLERYYGNNEGKIICTVTRLS